MPEEPKQHRKLAAIMFTDMVGYSALGQRDEKLALELLQEHRMLLRSVFTEYGGHEIETAGDAFMVEFESALGATRCAIAVQQMMHDRNSRVPPPRVIKLRIGIHLGDVVAIGTHVHGDGVNIAARIEPLSSAEGICLSEDVARQIQNKLEVPLLRLGKGELKNIRLPIHIYRVVMPWEKHPSAVTERMMFASRRVPARFYALAAAILIVGIALYIVQPSRSISRDRLSVAVLPFKNMSGETGSEFFSDGVTDDIIGQLSKIGSLKVISRTSMMQYKNTAKNLRTIGAELNVGTVLEGSVRRAENQLRIDARLIDAETDLQLWTATYDTVMSQVFSIQSDVAKKIATALRAKLPSDERERIEKKPTRDLEAYSLYLKGRYLWNKRLPDSLREGINDFNHAIAIDSTYALAYAGLADSYTLLGNFDVLPPGEAYPKAKAAAATALHLDSMLAEAHTSFAMTLMHYDRNWERADLEFKRAVALNTNYATGHSLYAIYLATMGRFPEAAVARERARTLDPYSPVISADYGLTLYFERRYDDVIEKFKSMLGYDPRFIAAYLPLGAAYEQKKMYSQALDAFQRATLSSKGHPVTVAALGHYYAVAGRRDEAILYKDLLLERAQEEYVSPYWISIVYLGLGETEKVFEWLEKAYEISDGSLVFVNVEPAFDVIRNDQRFVSLMRRLNMAGGVSTSAVQ